MANDVASRGQSKVIAGSILIFLGLVFLLDTWDLFDAGDIFDWWPLILIGIGLTLWMKPGESKNRTGGIILVAVGGWFLLEEFVSVRLDLWPVLLMLIGGVLIVQAIARRKQPEETSGQKGDSR